MIKAVISGTGLYTPPATIDNDELVEAFNQFVEIYNSDHADAIERGEITALHPSSSAFIEKASGIKRRHVIDKSGIVDPKRMAPYIPERSNDEPSVQCDMAVVACNEALAQAGKKASDVDAVIVACSNLQRAYPAIAVEVQDALGIEGFGFDMNVACSSATFGIQQARDSINAGSARCVLILNPEICSGHLNFRDRDSHFIFGDVCTAIILERADSASASETYRILDSRLQTLFSNNIRNNFGFLNHTAPEDDGFHGDRGRKGLTDKLFVQNGRSVFKEVVPMVAKLINDECAAHDIDPNKLKRMWLHQANLNMNILIAKKVLGKDVEIEQAPVVLDEYANTSSAGSIIAFHKHSNDFNDGDQGLICSFGAGYSAGAIFVRRVAA